MDQQLCQMELVRQAQYGDKECLNQLAQQARERLCTYVYRLTQRDDLTQEIVQETLFEMCKVLGKLKRTDRFWPWLYGIAVNKLRRYYRTEQTQRRVALSSATHNGTLSVQDRQDGLENLVSEELKEIVSTAMTKLRTRHKAVLIMRCYDGMTHSEIAESMGCSEFSTRMLFLRAKKALQRELSRNGFGKGSLLAALVLFGKMTAPTEAAAAQVSITAATTKVGVLAGIACLATTKTAIVSFTAASVLTAGTIVAPSMLSKQAAEAPGPSPVSTNAVGQFGQSNNSEEEYWYYFPQGPANSMMLRVKSGAVGDKSYWQILQNSLANYYYHDNSVQINNARMFAGDLSVLRIPTDDPKLTAFLYEVEASPPDVRRASTRPTKHISATGRGLLVIAARGEAKEDNWARAVRHYNVLEEDYFQGDWPATVKIIDNRDAMHRRDWTYFRVSGQINGQNVSGTGRIPFVYAASERYSPWLKLQVGSLTIVDTDREAHLSRSASGRLGTYAGGSFFKGLARPWMGFHTIDTVRRDAAEKRISFETKHTPGEPFAQVELICKGVRLVYNINLETDVIDEINFSTDQGSAGNLKFSYLQSIEGVSEEFRPPSRPRRGKTTKSGPGLLWLVQLVEGSLR
ncbi:MAG: RNA polymerase sigma factor [Planctomycetota bacterium]|jgi:RNA polymerase sigma-70 factor (ECF subfamily)